MTKNTQRLRHDLKRIKLNRVKRKPCKALSGGGYIRGRGDFAIQAPPPYKKKKNKKELNVSGSAKA